MLEFIIGFLAGLLVQLFFPMLGLKVRGFLAGVMEKISGKSKEP